MLPFQPQSPLCLLTKSEGVEVPAPPKGEDESEDEEGPSKAGKAVAEMLG